MTLAALDDAPKAPGSLARPVSASERIFGLDWRIVLPWTFDDGSSVEWGTLEEALAFVAAHYGAIFGDAGDRFLVEPMTAAKRRFFEEMDVFLLRAEGQTVGVAMAHPTDWSTYYVRTLAVVPEFRERRFTTAFARGLDAPLRAVGVQRIETDSSPANYPIVRVLSTLGYVVTATLNSERWGTMLRYTKFIDDEARKAFLRQFLVVPRFEHKNQSHEQGGRHEEVR